ncbi:MAG: LPS export ABC transporter periplasmic protein LptC [Desulfosarcinaceae bacterium]|nr:LPS export ABC transporter periplasmic protein LptC [Desulfosarcinaceae bacterium]
MKLTKARFSLLLTTIILITVGTIALRFYEERRGRVDQPPPVAPPTDATMALTNVRQTAVKNGIKEWHLEALAATLLEAKHQMILEQPTVEFFMENGEQLTLTAQKGILDTKTNDIQVSGQVVVRHQAYTLTGEAFAYSHAEERLVSQAPVTIIGDRLRLTAARMTVDLNTQQTELAGDVKGILNDTFSL